MVAFSNTVSQTTFNTRKVIDSAVRRCKLRAENISAEYLQIATDQLYLLLSALANQGLPLWCVQKSIYPLYEGNPAVTTVDGTIDILNANIRTLTALTGANTDTATERVVEFSDSEPVTTVGIKWSAASAPLEFARSDDGVSWTVIQTETPSASAGEWTWFDMDVSVASLFFRVRATSGTLDFETIYLGNTPAEIPLAALNRDSYTAFPNKAFQSNRPLQYWLDRQAVSPVMYFWPVPNSAAETSQIVVWAKRHVMDVGTLRQEIEVPQRWYDAVVAMLAARLAMELPEVDPGMIPMLDGKADAALAQAWDAESDGSPYMLAPNISAYTR